MKMYKSFRVQNFRGFKDLQLDDLARVNLIAGKNNTGKTALLEAIYTYTGVYDSSMLLRIPDEERRSFKSYRLEEGTHQIDPGWPLIFHDFEPSKPIYFCGQTARKGKPEQKENGTDIGKSQQLEISLENVNSLPLDFAARRNNLERVVDEKSRVLVYREEDLFWISLNPYTRSRNSATPFAGVPKAEDIPRETRHKSRFLPANTQLTADDDASLYSTIRLSGHDKKLLSVTSKIEPRIKHIELLKNGLEIELHVHLEGLAKPLPVSSMGEGIRRTIGLMLAIATNEDGIVLVDEIENGLHHSIHVEVWKAIADAARQYNVQVFATTHSYEMILAAHEAFSKKNPGDFGYFRLSRDRDNNDIRAVNYEPETLEAAIEVGFEVR